MTCRGANSYRANRCLLSRSGRSVPAVAARRRTLASTPADCTTPGTQSWRKIGARRHDDPRAARPQENNCEPLPALFGLAGPWRVHANFASCLGPRGSVIPVSPRQCSWCHRCRRFTGSPNFVGRRAGQDPPGHDIHHLIILAAEAAACSLHLAVGALRVLLRARRARSPASCGPACARSVAYDRLASRRCRTASTRIRSDFCGWSNASSAQASRTAPARSLDVGRCDGSRQRAIVDAEHPRFRQTAIASSSSPRRPADRRHAAPTSAIRDPSPA